MNTAINLSFDFLLRHYLPKVCRIAYEAGCSISDYYHQNDEVEIEHKSDGSPVTVADQEADKLICIGLKQLSSAIPMVTEESVAQISFAERQHWQTYWLVDPLDGTKEFISGTGEYSVNIALVHNHHPVLGVVYGPEQGDLYFAVQSHPDEQQRVFKSGKIENLQTRQFTNQNWQALIACAAPLKVAQNPAQKLANNEPISVAVSRRHGGALQHFMGQLGSFNKVKMGSALKTCLVAEGKADIYPRFGPTSLWDTAAAQCVLEAAGGAVLNAAGHPLEYVQTESLLNPFFIAVSDKDYDWPDFPEIM